MELLMNFCVCSYKSSFIAVVLVVTMWQPHFCVVIFFPFHAITDSYLLLYNFYNFFFNFFSVTFWKHLLFIWILFFVVIGFDWKCVLLRRRGNLVANGAARAVFKDIAKSRKRSGAEKLVKILKKKIWKCKKYFI